MLTDRTPTPPQRREAPAAPSARIDLHAVDGAENLHALRRFATSNSTKQLDPNLIELVQARVLQLIGGAFVERQKRAIAEAHPDLGRKIACLPDWYTSRAFSAREKAALKWAEDIVYTSSGGLSDIAYTGAAKMFTPAELWALAIAVAATSAWTQIAQAFHLDVTFETP